MSSAQFLSGFNFFSGKIKARNLKFIIMPVSDAMGFLGGTKRIFKYDLRDVVPLRLKATILVARFT
jgi:hypothetical protein